MKKFKFINDNKFFQYMSKDEVYEEVNFYEETGNYETYSKTETNNPYQERYNQKLGLIRIGHIFYVQEAENLAKTHGFNVAEIEDAYQKGVKIQYLQMLSFIERGNLQDRHYALNLARTHEHLPIGKLEEAIRKGTEKVYQKQISLIEEGNLSMYSQVKDFANKYNLPKGKLEEAFKKGKIHFKE